MVIHTPLPAIGRSMLGLLIPSIIYWVELLRGEHTCIDEIHFTYDRIKASLRDTHGGEGNETLKTVRIQGDEITHRIENLLDESEYYIERQGHLRCILKYLYNITHTCNLCSIAREINKIQKAAAPIQDLLCRFAHTGLGTIQTGRLENRHMAPVLNEFDFVGMIKSQQDLLQLLLDEEKGLKVIAVTGMAGAGKTTLTRHVYEKQQVKRHFNCRAWVQLEDSFTTKQMLLSLVTELHAESKKPLPEGISIMETDQLAGVILRYLEENRRRYVIVLDGASERNLEKVQLEFVLNYALPKDNNGCRVVITTRNQQIVRQLLPQNHIIDVAALSNIESWILFCKRAFGQITDPPPHEAGKYIDRINDLCGGLPLAISVLGGILRREFHKYDKIITEFERSQTLGDATEILRASINDIDDENEKSCLLYFCSFPRSYAVTENNLIRLWCAEGFSQTEEAAKKYLSNLVERNIIQAAEGDYYEHAREGIKSYKVHDLMHGVLRIKAEESNFGTSSMSHQPRTYKRVRRLSVSDTSEVIPSKINLSQLRALFIFTKDTLILPSILSTIRSLWVLSLENVPIGNFPKEILKCTHLRYLNLQNTKVNEIPTSIGNLRNLKTLNLKGTFVETLPKEILKLKNLHHLLAYRYDTLRYTHDPRRPDKVFGVKAPEGIGQLNKLYTLSVVVTDNDGDIIKDLANLHQLRRLGVMDLMEKDGKNLFRALNQMENISSVSITLKENELLDIKKLQLDQGAPRRLQRLYLRGGLKGGLPDWFSSLSNLARLRLSGSQLPHESIDNLKNLPNLVDLSLIRAFNVKILLCQGGFTRLKVLDIDQFDNLVKVEIREAMSQLTKMIISSCPHLERIPLGIEKLLNVKELHLFEMPSEFVNKLRIFSEDGEKVQHIESKWVYNDGIQKEQVESAYTDTLESGGYETASEGKSGINEDFNDEITELEE
ncbi:Disease resistance protein (CC-NBS-LRR class) family [Rhynchospora pubera]|uniref:Disease resistance protein (CC-NBS-LRR class) family n=1 Tax=Rhynchospora pubera TaxID=906938 RepID=A0AAV8GTH9_9POAL|nr:Disease resistance protein (CC-NBS-LRR class) family [Rhynchospora pubera]